MGYGYNLEDAKTKLPPAIEEVEQFFNEAAKAKDTLREIAKDVGADKLTKTCETACTAIEAMETAFRGMLGEDGDKMADGTMHGALTGVRVMDETLNGGN